MGKAVRPGHDTSVTMRMPLQTKELIEKAATTVNKTFSAFVIESAREQAVDVLLDRSAFDLSADQAEAFACARGSTGANGEAEGIDAKQGAVGVVEQLSTDPKPYAAPRPIEDEDWIKDFECGKPPLDDFLKRRAIRNEGSFPHLCRVFGGRRRCRTCRRLLQPCRRCRGA